MIHLGVYQIPQVKGSVPQDCPPFQMSPQVVHPQVTHNFCPTCYKSEVSMTFSPPWIWLIARTILRTQGNTFTSLLRDLPKDTDEQPDEEIHRVRSRWILTTGASVPMELGCPTLLEHGTSPGRCLGSPHEIFPNPILLGFVEASSQRHEQTLTLFPSHLLSLVTGWG